MARRSQNLANRADRPRKGNAPRRRRALRLSLLLLALAALLAAVWWTGAAAWLPLRWSAAALVDRDYERAVQWARTAQRFDADSPEAEFLLARAARKQGRLRDTAEHLARAQQLGLDRERIQREELLARAQTGEIDPIRIQLDGLLVDQRGDGAEICEAYVNGLLFNGRFDAARTLLEQWQQAFPDDPQPHFMRGRLYEHSKGVQPAEAEYRTALEKSPTHWPAAFALARLLLDQQKPQQALPLLRRCEAMPNNAAVRIAIARCLRTLGKSDEARRILTEVAALDRETVAASYRALGESTHDLEAALELGRLELPAENYAEAAEWLRQAVEFNPRNHDARYQWSQALRGLGKADEAARELQRVQRARTALQEADALHDAIHDNPDDIESRYGLGIAYLEHGSEQTGLYWLRTVLTHDPRHKPTHRALADYYGRKSAETQEFARLAAEHARLAE